MSARVCKGSTCDRSLAGRRANVKWCSPKCHEKHRRMDLRDAAVAAGLPPTLTRQAIEAATRSANNLRGSRRGTSAPRKARPGDVRLSYRKVFALMAAHLGDDAARELLGELLTQRQRDLLRGRG